MFSTHQPFVKIGIPFIHLSEIDSTNNYALDLIKKQKAVSGTVVFAEKQTKGKGQRGKQWHSKAYENIILSIILDVSKILIQKQFILNAFAAVACYDFFKKYAGNSTAIKWPNDLYFNDKKAGGILIETINHQNKRYAIIGIGINVNQKIFDSSIPNPTSLSIITENEFIIPELSKELLIHLNHWLPSLFENEKHILHAYNQYLYKKNQPIVLKKGSIRFNCIVEAVNDYGELIISNALQTSVQHGEVEWIIP